MKKKTLIARAKVMKGKEQACIEVAKNLWKEARHRGLLVPSPDLRFPLAETGSFRSLRNALTHS